MSKMGLFWCFKTGIFHVQLEKDSLINIFRILTQREQVILEEKLLFSSCTLRCECFTQAFKNSYLLLSRLSPIPEAKKKSVFFFFFLRKPFSNILWDLYVYMNTCMCVWPCYTHDMVLTTNAITKVDLFNWLKGN